MGTRKLTKPDREAKITVEDRLPAIAAGRAVLRRRLPSSSRSTSIRC